MHETGQAGLVYSAAVYSGTRHQQSSYTYTYIIWWVQQKMTTTTTLEVHSPQLALTYSDFSLENSKLSDHISSKLENFFFEKSKKIQKFLFF